MVFDSPLFDQEVKPGNVILKFDIALVNYVEAHLYWYTKIFCEMVWYNWIQGLDSI